MPKAYDWKKEQINNKWYLVCTNYEHMPMVKFNSDGTYSVTGSNGKPRVEKELKDAMKFAIETFKKMTKFNKKFDEEK